MKQICFFDKNNNLINIGNWEYKPMENENGQIIETNNLPDGSYSEEREIFIDDRNGKYIK